MRDGDLATTDADNSAQDENTQLFSWKGDLVGTVYVPPAVFDVLSYRGRIFVKKVGRYVEASMYEARG
jgi:hypothetical protein